MDNNMNEKTNENSIFEQLLDERMITALEQSLSKDMCYQDTCATVKEKLKSLFDMKLDDNQRAAVDMVLSAQNLNSSEYGRAAYRQGFKDCLILLQEIDQL